VTPDVDEDEHLDDGAGVTDPVGSAGPTEVSELVGWQPISRLAFSGPSPMG
jgi:hypothetical protein